MLIVSRLAGKLSSKPVSSKGSNGSVWKSIAYPIRFGPLMLGAVSVSGGDGATSCVVGMVIISTGLHETGPFLGNLVICVQTDGINSSSRIALDIFVDKTNPLQIFSNTFHDQPLPP